MFRHDHGTPRYNYHLREPGPGHSAAADVQAPDGGIQRMASLPPDSYFPLLTPPGHQGPELIVQTEFQTAADARRTRNRLAQRKHRSRKLINQDIPMNLGSTYLGYSLVLKQDSTNRITFTLHVLRRMSC